MDLTTGEQDRSMLATIVDPTVKLVGGDRWKKFCTAVPDMPGATSATLDLEALKKMQEFLKIQRSSSKAGRLSLVDIFCDGELQLPSLEIPERDVKLEERVQKLRLQLANQEYKKMTENVSFDSRYQPEDSIGMQLRQMNAGLIAVFQFVVTIGAAFAFGFLGVEVLWGYPMELAVKLLLGIILSLIVGIAEFYFLLLNIDIEEKNSSKREAKKDL